MSEKSNIDSLLGDTSSQVIDALWQEYFTSVMFYTCVNITHFAVIVLYVMYGMDNYIYQVAISLTSSVMLFKEYIEYMSSEGFVD